MIAITMLHLRQRGQLRGLAGSWGVKVGSGSGDIAEEEERSEGVAPDVGVCPLGEVVGGRVEDMILVSRCLSGG